MALFGIGVPAKPATPAVLVCNFCNKTQLQVKKLIAGQGVNICDECVRLSMEILVKEDAPKRAIPGTIPAATLLATLQPAVVGQRAACQALAAALAQHLARCQPDAAPARAPITLIVGPRGSGKTTLLRAFSTATTLPRVMADANRVTATGYVGDDVENLLHELLADCDDDVGLARCGVLVIDGAHRWGRLPPNPSVTKDVSGEGVQRNLVRILDGDTCRVMSGTRHPSAPSTPLSCARLLIVLAATMEEPPTDDRALRERLVADGLLDEVVARIDRIVRTQRPDEATLAEVLTRPGGLLAQRNALLAPFGATIQLAPDAVARLAAWAAADPDAGWALHRVVSGLVERVLVDPAPGRAWTFGAADLAL